MDVFLDPDDPAVARAGARATASPDDWLEAARARPSTRSPSATGVALPLHPEYRTLPMVWYVPPLSPIVNALETDGYEADPDDLFPAIEKLRIPLEYLANLLSAGDVDVIRDVLRRLAAMRGYMRKQQVLGEHDERAARLGRAERPQTSRTCTGCSRSRKYDERYVIPQAHAELADRLAEQGAVRLPRLRGRPGQLRRGRTDDNASASCSPSARSSCGWSGASPRDTRGGRR